MHTYREYSIICGVMLSLCIDSTVSHRKLIENVIHHEQVMHIHIKTSFRLCRRTCKSEILAVIELVQPTNARSQSLGYFPSSSNYIVMYHDSTRSSFVPLHTVSILTVRYLYKSVTMPYNNKC